MLENNLPQTKNDNHAIYEQNQEAGKSSCNLQRIAESGTCVSNTGSRMAIN